MELDDKINSAIRILKLAEVEAQRYNEPVEIAYSGGKDSDVLLQLAKESGIYFRAIYKNTTIDPPGTMQHVRANNVEILPPKTPFFDLIKKKGFPSMFRRFCCQELKEYKVLNVACLGIRKEESPRRKKRYKTFEMCRIYKNKSRVRQYFPIVDWSLNDIKLFIEIRKISLAPFYYKNGIIDYKLRLGCLGCPLKNDRGINDFKAHPAILRAWIRAGQIYTHTHTHCLTNFNNNVFNAFFGAVFCRSLADYKIKISKDLFGNELDTKQYIEEYFNIKFIQ